jgi:HEAT repeat protein
MTVPLDGSNTAKGNSPVHDPVSNSHLSPRGVKWLLSWLFGWVAESEETRRKREAQAEAERLAELKHNMLRDKHRAAEEAARVAGEMTILKREATALKREATAADHRVRSEAIQALAEAKQGVEILITALSDDHRMVRECAARGLTMIPDKRAVEPLIGLLRNDFDDGVRSSAARALGKIGDLCAVPHLIAALQPGNDRLSAALTRYYEWVDSRSHEEFPNPDYLSKDAVLLIRSLRWEAERPGKDIGVVTREWNAALRRSIVHALYDLNTPAAVEAMRNVALTDPNPQVVDSARAMLRHLGHSDPVLLKQAAETALEDRTGYLADLMRGKTPKSKSVVEKPQDDILTCTECRGSGIIVRGNKAYGGHASSSRCSACGGRGRIT